MKAIAILVIVAGMLPAEETYSTLKMKDGRVLEGYWDPVIHHLKIKVGSVTSDLKIEPTDVDSIETCAPPVSAPAKDPMQDMSYRIAVLEREVSALQQEVERLKMPVRHHPDTTVTPMQNGPVPAQK